MTSVLTYRKCKTAAGDVEAVIERRWYADRGFYRIEVSGFGVSEAEASKSAQAVLVQASAAVSLAINDMLAEQP